MNTTGDLLQSLRAMVNGVKRRHGGQQRLCGADVGGGLLALDMLFSCLKCHPECLLTVGILRNTDDASRHGALVLVPGSEESC